MGTFLEGCSQPAMEMLQVFAAAAVVCLLLFSLRFKFQIWSSLGSGKTFLPPGSYGMPIVGETMAYMWSMCTSRPTFMAERCKRYGDMFKTKLMGAKCVVATAPDVIKFLLDHDGKQFQTGYPAGFKKVLGEYTTLSLHDENWKRSRKFLVKSFRVDRLKAHIPVVEKLVLENLATWEDTEVVCVRDKTKALAFNVVAHFLLGSRLASSDVKEALREDFYTLTEGLFAMPVNFPTTKFSKALKARARIIDTIEREVLSQPRAPGDEDHYTDYMEYLREENHPATTEAMLLEQTRCHVLGLMFAGHQTAACTMLFAVKNLLENPGVLENLLAEHDGIRRLKVFPVGRKIGLTWEEYKSMRYTQHVITETIRLANPAALLWRETKEDVQLNGYVVPKGWKMACAIREAHHNPDYFSDPGLFDPSRHEKEINDPSGKLPFFGFGGGPRHCPGAELARMEMSIFLYHLTTKFGMELELCGKEKMSFFPVPKMSRGLQVRLSNIQDCPSDLEAGQQVLSPDVTTLPEFDPRFPDVRIDVPHVQAHVDPDHPDVITFTRLICPRHPNDRIVPQFCPYHPGCPRGRQFCPKHPHVALVTQLDYFADVL